MGVSDVPMSSVHPIFGLFVRLSHLYSISTSFSGAKADKMRARGASAFREGGMFACNVGLGTQSARHKNVFKSADHLISQCAQATSLRNGGHRITYKTKPRNLASEAKYS